MNSRKYLRNNHDLCIHSIPHLLTNKSTVDVSAKPQTLNSIWSHERAESIWNISSGRDSVGGNVRKIPLRSPCIDVLAIRIQRELSAIVVANMRIHAEETVQFSIILRFAARHSENDLRLSILAQTQSELLAVV